MNINLLQDSLNAVDMATFLDDSSILLKMGNRFMQFTQNGKFISEVDFEKDDKDWNNRVTKMVVDIAVKIKGIKKKMADRNVKNLRARK